MRLTWSEAILMIFKNNKDRVASVQDIYLEIGKYRTLDERELEYTKWDEPRYHHIVRATLNILYNDGVIDRIRRGVYILK